MPSLNTKVYYEAINGQSSLSRGQWYINYDKRQAHRIYSDFDAVQDAEEKIVVNPTESTTEVLNYFSDTLNQKLKNTKVTDEGDGTEKIELELDDRVVTIVMDQSGSMTWNDNNNFRHDIAKDIVTKIENNYPGEIKYNLIEYGAVYVNVLFFGALEDNIDTNDTNTVNSILSTDADANYSGIRVVRSNEDYPLAYTPGSGTSVSDGFIGRVLDTGLTEGQDYYYRVYTYNSDLAVSEGRTIKVTPKTRNVPRGISIFETFPEDNSPLVANGINKDSSVLGLWHLSEGEGSNIFDFVGNLDLSFTREDPRWYSSEFVPEGSSGLFFDGEGGYASASDPNNRTEILFTGSDNSITISAWVYPYNVSEVVFLSRDNTTSFNYAFATNSSGNLGCNIGDGATAEASTLTLQSYKWQHVAVTYNGGSDVTFYLNGQSEQVALLGVASHFSDVNYNVNIGEDGTALGIYPFRGKMTEISVHNEARSSSYINSYLTENPIYNGENEQIDTEYIGVKEDNGDRLVVLKFQIPDDYNFEGGGVRIVRNSIRIPSWEEDGDIIYDETVSSGIHYVSDAYDFVLGETYYYRIYTYNSLGNFCFAEDATVLEITIPDTEDDTYFVSLSSSLPSPIEVSGYSSIIAGNKKTFLRWVNPSDNRIKRIRIFYSSLDYPSVDQSGYSNGSMVFSGEPTSTNFVHRNIDNDVDAYYSIVNIDKYGRASEPLFLVSTPSSDADDNAIPLIDVNNLRYELIDGNSVSLQWDQPQKNPEDIEAYFDDTVVLYGSITDQYGVAISEDTPIRMYIDATITRETQADDVFNTTSTLEFDDSDAYTFFVTRTEGGVLKATLRMTTDTRIISQISNAEFDVQIKSYIPNTGYVSPSSGSDNVAVSGPFAEYASAIEAAIEGVDGESSTQESNSSSDNIFEYLSHTINVRFTNPWEIELENKNNLKVPQRCYVQKTDPYTKEKYLVIDNEMFNGVYMGSSTPFVARAKLKYKGEPISSGSINVAVWDADNTNLCANAGNTTSAGPYEGPKTKVSTIVTPPNSTMGVLLGTETREVGGETVSTTISYVDIPIYAPDMPQAVRLFVKGSNAGYSSVKDIYILFQSILQIDIQAGDPEIDGKSVAEQQAIARILHPDYPTDKSLVTYPDDSTVVQWKIVPIQGNERNLYSVDNVPIPNGVYSYTRNGVARSVFLGPIQRGSTKIDEVQEVSATIVYNGLSSTAKQYIRLEYDPDSFEKFQARFLMEVDGGWRGYGSSLAWRGAGWLDADLYPLWTDGSDYKRMKISRDPANTTSDFKASTCFINCADQDDSQVFELSSGQVVHVNLGDDNLEIIHGEVSEELDPYTGRYVLNIGRNGFVDYGDAYIQLNDEEESDITYFYIRANKFASESGAINNSDCDDENEINKCLCLAKDDTKGLTQCDLPRWSPVVYAKGETTIFVNDQPLVLFGGGDFYNGIPPCPIALKEPLALVIDSKWVIDDGERIEVYNDNFLDADGNTLVKHDSDVYVKVRVLWRGESIPDDTPIYVSIGNNTIDNLFIASRYIYYTATESDGFSYVTVRLSASRVPEETTTETIKMYSVYDENGETDRNVFVQVNLTINREDETVDTVSNPSIVTTISSAVVTPYSRTMERYDINNDEWTLVREMTQSRGNAFVGSVGSYIYVAGGMKGNGADISSITERYDADNDEWSTVSNMITPRFGGSTVVIGTDIYTLGGISLNLLENGEADVSLANEVYHTDTGLWESLTPFPVISTGAFEDRLGVAFGTAQHFVIGAKNYIYVLSGIKRVSITSSSSDIREYNNRILRYCIEDDQWAYSDILFTDEILTYNRIFPLSIKYDDKIIVFNGAKESGGNFVYPSDDFCISPELSMTRTGTQRYIQFNSGYLGDFPSPKFQSAMAEYDPSPSTDNADYYIFGGVDSSSSSLDAVEQITVSSNNFDYNASFENEDSSNLLTRMLTAKHGASAAYCNVSGSPYIYIIGGYTDARGDDSIDINFG